MGTVCQGVYVEQQEKTSVLSTRVTQQERNLVRALAAARGTSVCELVRESLLPVVREQLHQLTAGAKAGAA